MNMKFHTMDRKIATKAVKKKDQATFKRNSTHVYSAYPT